MKTIVPIRLLAVLLFLCAIIPASAQQQTDPIPIALPVYEGYISVSPNGRYFVDEQGRGFLVIGQNDAISWAGLNTLFDGTSAEETERYVQDLRAHGITVSRIMIEYAQQAYSLLENPVGTFSDAVVAFWDAFIPMAEANGLYLLLTPYDTFWQSANWESYPYNTAMGGACETRGDWLTGRACIEAQKDRWQFIIERWGGSPNIFAWDIMNEIDLGWEATTDEIDAYITEMAGFIRELEMATWGRTHLITVSSAESVPEGALGRVIYQHPALDFATTHQYIGEISDPSNPILPGTTMAGGVLLSLEQITDHRPYFDSESGPIADWIVNPQFDQEYHHNMSWGHLASCGAGSGMRWPYTNPHYLLPELRDNLLGLARVASTINWADYASENVTANVSTGTRTVFRSACSNGFTALVWLLADRRTDETVQIPGVTVTINDLFEDGAHIVQYWETYAGELLYSEPAYTVDGITQIVIPDFGVDLRDLALIILPYTGS